MQAAVVGASGYAGGELVRILDGHPELSLEGLYGNRHAGSRLSAVHPNLAGGDRVLDAVELESLASHDVVFLALPHGASADFGKRLRELDVLVVDLGSDYRLDSDERYEAAYGQPHPHPDQLASWVYALPELFEKELVGARAIAVPGCYPTATLLALAPLIDAGLVSEPDVVVDAISGVTGAGRGLKDSLLYGNIAEGAKAYGVGGHRHRPEMVMAAGKLGADLRITFTPHLAPFQRGLIATVSVPTSADEVDVPSVLREFYAERPMVEVSSEPPSTRWVAGAHGAKLWGALDVHSSRIIVISVIDNLGKGAAGQAVQALNVAVGWPETLGLTTDGWLA